MESALFFVGVLAFAILTLNYFRIAFQTANIWLLMGVLFLPSCIGFYVKFWDRYKPQAIVHGVSFFGLALFSTLYLRAYPFEFEQTALAPLRNLVAPAFAEAPLPIEPLVYATDAEMARYLKPGTKRAVIQVDQRRLLMKRALVSNGILRFKTRVRSAGSVEVAIDLNQANVANPDIVELDLTPSCSHLPPVYVLAFSDIEHKPSIEVYDHGYWLELSLNKMGNHYYEGFINLKLPDGDQSFVAGYFDAYDMDLIWDLGEVDRSHNSNHTIKYVAEQYLVNKLGSALASVQGFSDTFFQTTLEEPHATTRASLQMVDGSQHQIELNLFKGKDGWTVEHSPVRELIAALNSITKAPPAAINLIQQPTQISVFSIDEVDSLVGRSVVIVTQNGRVREGVLNSVDRYNVSLTTQLEGGSMAMLVRRREVKEIQLKD